MEKQSKKLNDDASSAGNSSADTSSASTPYETQAINKSKMKMWWVWALIVVVVLAAAGVAYYSLTSPKPKTTESGAKDVKATHFASAKELVDKVSPDLKGTRVEISSSNGLGGNTAKGYMAYSTPRYHTDGYKFDNLPIESSGASVMGSSTVASDNYDTLVAFFTDNHFKQVQSDKDHYAPLSWNGENGIYVSYDLYESDNLVCMIWHADASQTQLANHVTSVGCGDKSSYAKAAKALDPLYTAYAKATNNTSEHVLLGLYGAGTGKEGYEYVSLYQENPNNEDEFYTIGQYYKASNSSTWTYVGEAKGPLACSKYDSDASKKAFSGVKCYDETTKSDRTVIALFD